MSDIAAIKELSRELVSFYLSLRFEIHGRVGFTAKRLIEIGVFLLTIVASGFVFFMGLSLARIFLGILWAFRERVIVVGFGRCYFCGRIFSREITEVFCYFSRGKRILQLLSYYPCFSNVNLWCTRFICINGL